MKRFPLTPVLFLSCVLIAFSCNKDKASLINKENANSISAASSADDIAGTCSSFAYPDTLLYPSDYPAEYVISTVTRLSGTFGSYPDALEIDERTGNIEIGQSETGLKYLVWYVATGTRDTCKVFLTVSGVNYPDSIFTLKNAAGVATPVYNGTAQPAICTSNCEFDDGHDDDNGNGFLDEPPAGQEIIPQGVSMDKVTGSINLKQTVQNGAFGANPVPGTFKDYILNYRLSDRSANALNHMTLRMYYYKNQSQIPAALKRDLATKKKFVSFNNETDPYKVSYTVKTRGGGSNLVAAKGAKEVKCRPPYIIVVQQ